MHNTVPEYGSELLPIKSRNDASRDAKMLISQISVNRINADLTAQGKSNNYSPMSYAGIYTVIEPIFTHNYPFVIYALKCLSNTHCLCLIRHVT